MFSRFVSFAFLACLSAVLGIASHTRSTSTEHRQVESNAEHTSGFENTELWSMYGTGGNDKSSSFPFSRVKHGRKKSPIGRSGKGSSKQGK
ncbi:hypothetical protein PCANC_08460 [Puccinia coronata f. sp. avenae]|uniref:Uncharacterized protein n=1 Tax=Puccinia coronata f. sp. avenae TaxID=200324 RepID=A0A2N5T4A8_9BASI|nr:hypothetical protein PCANC_08460 [Puccinia coronata f. sp. avenae]